jgi:lipid-A-disaccharide synthase
MRSSDLAIAASGTVTLEIALFGVPLILVYKVSTLSYMIFRRMIRIPYIGLANIISGRKIVPEFIQNSVELVLQQDKRRAPYLTG